MLKNTQKQECLVVCCCTQQKTRVMNISYSVQEESSRTINQIISEVDLYWKTNKPLSKSLKLIQDSTIPRDPSPGQHLEVVTLDGSLLIPWVTLTPPLNGHTTETSITACQDDKNGFDIYQIPVRLFHHESRDTQKE